VSDPYRSAPDAPYRSPGRPRLPCPRCDAGLSTTELAGVRIEQCDRCAGTFVVTDTMREIIEQAATVDELRALLPREPTPWADGGRVYVKCPVCATLMNRRQYASGARVVIDWCRHHGVWFDGGELARVLDFVANGGLARAAARDANDAREAERRERNERTRERLRQPQTVGPLHHTTDKPFLEWLADLLWVFK
jgi:Zn-finger nucleic acid-binding protein